MVLWTSNEEYKNITILEQIIEKDFFISIDESYLDFSDL